MTDTHSSARCTQQKKDVDEAEHIKPMHRYYRISMQTVHVRDIKLAKFCQNSCYINYDDQFERILGY